MQVLIRNRDTQLYFIDNNQWTSERHQARDFHTSGNAVLFAHSQGLQNVEAVLSFEDPRFDITLPICPPSTTPPSGSDRQCLL